MNRNLPECEAFDTLVNEVLDGMQPVSVMAADPHGMVCATCQDTAAAAKLLLGREWPTPVVPAGFADRVLERERATVVARRQGWQTATAVLTSLAASVAVLALAIPNSSRRSEQQVAAVTPPRIDESLAQARTALVSLTKRTAGESILPATQLFASVTPAELPRPSKSHAVQVSPPPSTTFAPVTNTTRRAIDLFVRDLGGLAGVPKRNS